MKKELLNIKLPKKYEEGLFEYKEGLDNVPDWLELKKRGYTWDEHIKLNKLVEIENMKYCLNEAINNGEISEAEVEETKSLINVTIKEYNNM